MGTQTTQNPLRQHHLSRRGPQVGASQRARPGRPHCTPGRPEPDEGRTRRVRAPRYARCATRGERSSWWAASRSREATPLHSLARKRQVGDPDRRGVPKGRHRPGPLPRLLRSGATRWPLFDMLGTVHSFAASDQTLSGRVLRDAFGPQLATTGSLPGPFGYVGALGYYHDPDLAMPLLSIRHYAPKRGLFISRDPILSQPAYGYVGGLGTGRVDGGGRIPVTVVIAGVAYVIYGLNGAECAQRIDEYVSDQGPIGPILKSGKTWERDKWQQCFANCLISAICGGPWGLVAIPGSEWSGVFDWGDVTANKDGWSCGTGLVCRLGIAPEPTVIKECDACCVRKGYIRIFDPGAPPGFPPIPPTPPLPPYQGGHGHVDPLPPPGDLVIGRCYRYPRTGRVVCN